MSVRPPTRSHESARIGPGTPRSGGKGIAATDSPLFLGRQSFERREWVAAFTQLSAADRASPLSADDLHRLAVAAYLAGRDQDSGDLWTRAHQELITEGNIEGAARCAFWLGMTLLFDLGQAAPGSGWIARARRLLDDHDCGDCVERGYLLMPAGIGRVFEGNFEAARATFAEAVAIANRFGDADLRALARQGEGRALTRLNRLSEGVAMLDEAMVAVMAGDVSPIPAGVIYCSVIEACHEIFDLRRAQEWTAALGRWCDSQPGLMPFRGQCLVRRSEILLLHGAWSDAMTEAERGCERLLGRPAAGAALYQLAEIYRLRGDFTKAEQTYGLVAQRGKKTEPGQALLRLAQGHVDAAAAAIRRARDEAHERRWRCQVLIADIEIMIAAADLTAAREAADELSAIAADLDAPFLKAAALHGSGAVLLAEQNPRAALVHLRSAWTTWRELDVPYEAARTGVLLGVTCRALGDLDAAAMEFDLARQTFQQMGAGPDLARLATVSGPAATKAATKAAGGLTGREAQVLSLVATGKTNRAIADALHISDKTVARHLSNIFTKLGVSTRAGATAYAYQHELA
jgi:DNA-binding CsgD family transcriptional regulator